MHKIHPDLILLACPVEDLRVLTGNPRQGDVEAVAKSLDTFGQRKPVVAQVSSGEITGGNHTYMAAVSLGWDQVAVVWVEEDDASAKAFSLADNRTAELGGFDQKLLYTMIQEVMEDDASLIAATSYSDSDISALLASFEEVEDEPEEEKKSRPATITLNERFMIGPFTVLNSREGTWRDRKKAWLDLGIESELGREGETQAWNLSAPTGHGHGPNPLVPRET